MSRDPKYVLKDTADAARWRAEVQEILQREEYGYLPAPPKSLRAEDISLREGPYLAGKGKLLGIRLNMTLEGGEEFSFPFYLCLPKNGAKKHKCVILINFRREIPDIYYPTEELCDLGWAVADLCYLDITSDSASIDGLRAKTGFETGKLMLWAYAAMRVCDYLLTRDDIDSANIGVVGHSRLGKTALVAAAFDERFAFSHSNCSGTGGAGLMSEWVDGAEPIETITRVFPYWFSPNYRKYSAKEKEMPFDQDMLVALIAPRVVSIGSAQEDKWANPRGEMLCGKQASYVWELYGEKGLICDDHPIVGTDYHEGKIGYYCRTGMHYFSRNDWKRLLSHFDKHLN